MDEADGVVKGLMRDEVEGFNHFQINCLVELKKEGVTANILRGWQGEEFTYNHHAALIELVQKKHQIPETAIAEINQLSSAQAEGIANGLSREEVIDFNEYQIETLIMLKGKLTADQLHTWQGDEFWSSHKDALEYLISKHQINAQDAIAEINELNESEAYGITKGLTRNEVIGLNIQQMEALLKLRKNLNYELTPAHLRNWQGNYFSNFHREALIDLIKNRHFKPEDTIIELNNLNEFEARMIAERNLTRDEVVGFNGWEVNILQNLKTNGLLPIHLRNRIPPADSKTFFHGHAKALTYLIKQCGIKPEDAVKEINELDNNQAIKIANGETREQILECTLQMKS